MSKTLKSVEIGDEKLLEIKQLLLTNKKVRIHGLGTLKIREVKEVTKFSHFTQGNVTIPAMKRLAFVPLESVKQFINNN